MVSALFRSYAAFLQFIIRPMVKITFLFPKTSCTVRKRKSYLPESTRTSVFGFPGEESQCKLPQGRSASRQ